MIAINLGKSGHFSHKFKLFGNSTVMANSTAYKSSSSSARLQRSEVASNTFDLVTPYMVSRAQFRGASSNFVKIRIEKTLALSTHFWGGRPFFRSLW